MTLNLLGSRLAPTGALTLAGANDEGIRSCGKTLEEVFEEVKMLDARRHCRVWEARVPRPGLRASADAWMEELEADSPLGRLRWWSYPGCFAHGRLDEGSCRLMHHLPETAEPIHALDFACGAGALSLALKQRCPQVTLDLTDADALAVRAAQRALPEARVWCRDGLRGLKGRTYDLIMSNPPLHDGVQADRRVLEGFLGKVRDHLKPEGVLLLVTERSVQISPRVQLKGVKSLEEGQGFRVWTGRR
jgi:16S rRNA (guanine1207-N2)-methyltransferase